MDQIFDRLGNLLKSTLRTDQTDTSTNNKYSDPDLQDAWDELNDFLNEEETSARSEPSFTSTSFPGANALPKEIRDAYDALGVVPSVSNVELAKSYKMLLLKHHPDRVAGDPGKVAAATEKTKTINRAFTEIKAYRANTA